MTTRQIEHALSVEREYAVEQRDRAERAEARLAEAEELLREVERGYGSMTYYAEKARAFLAGRENPT